jgi:hypothetical protein
MREDGYFKPGQSGNPRGRPKGSRHKLSEAFLAELVADFEGGGRAAIERCRLERPDVYVRLVASLLPKQQSLTDETGGHITVSWADSDPALSVVPLTVEIPDQFQSGACHSMRWRWSCCGPAFSAKPSSPRHPLEL